MNRQVIIIQQVVPYPYVRMSEMCIRRYYYVITSLVKQAMVFFVFLSLSLSQQLLHKVYGNQAANANLTLKNSHRNQDRAYFLLYTILHVYAHLPILPYYP
jgi:hypothetical protein